MKFAGHAFNLFIFNARFMKCEALVWFFPYIYRYEFVLAAINWVKIYRIYWLALKSQTERGPHLHPFGFEIQIGNV